MSWFRIRVSRMRKRDFSISDDKRISCLSFCSLCIGKKHRFRSLFPFGNLPLKRCFLFFIYDLISRSSIRRTAAFLSPLFSEILRPDRTRSGRCRICGCFQDRSDGSGLRTGRRARSKPSTVHPSQSSEVPDRSVCWRGSRLPLPQFFPWRLPAARQNLQRRCSHRRNGLSCFWRRTCGIPRC